MVRSGCELQVETNGHLTADVFDPETGERVGGVARPQGAALVVFRAAPGETVRVPLRIGTASNKVRLGYLIPPGEWHLEAKVRLGPYPRDGRRSGAPRACRSPSLRRLNRRAMGAIHDWATPENFQPEPITVEIWRNLREEFCRLVKVVNGQAVRREAPGRTDQAAARRLATVWGVPDATIRRPDVALHNCAPDDVRPLPASYIRVIIEVVSPGSDKIDRVEKTGEYATAGIPFYWLVWITGNQVASIDVHVLDHVLGAYRLLRTLGPEGRDERPRGTRSHQGPVEPAQRACPLAPGNGWSRSPWPLPPATS